MSAAEGSELLRLLRIVNQAIEDGQLHEALRHADRAWRQMPGNAEIVRIYARLLLAHGEAPQALAVLTRAAASWDDPHLEAAILDALLATGETRLAGERLSAALARFAVAPGDELAAAARRVAQSAPDMSGWIGVTDRLEFCGELVGGPQRGPELEFTLANWRDTRNLAASYSDEGVAAFTIAPAARPAARTALTARVADTPLLGSGIGYPPDFRVEGRVTAANGVVEGWARLGWAPHHGVRLVLGCDEISLCLPTSPDPADARRHLFSFDRGALGLRGNRFEISALLPDGGAELLPDAPLLIEPGRARVTGRPRPGQRATARTQRIDVIVPVYRGYDETLACIDSVLATAGASVELVVIDDASPEADLAAALAKLAAAKRITLMRNERNLGFPASVNRGLELHPDRDVVILNADAQVFEGWLERLSRAAYSAPDIATVTPLSNSGSIASYPARETVTPGAAEAAELSQLSAAINRDGTIDIPTGVGFCLYMRRDCLRDIGGFDAEIFAKGYGEENDFCLRASAAGWRHVLAADVFVLHRGGRSFGVRREALTERGLRLLNRRYPGYQATIDAYQDKDPAHPIRRNLDEALLLSKIGRCVILVTLALPGGVERHVRDRSDELKKEGFHVLRLQPLAAGSDVCVLATDDPALQDLRYAAPVEVPQLRALLSRLLVDHVEIHHFLGLHPQVMEAVMTLGRPFDVVIHDYALVCPRIMFAGREGKYCGMPDLHGCEACIAEHGSLLGEEIDVAALRQRSTRWLRAARTIRVPSTDTAARLGHYIPGLATTLRPWEQFSAPRPEHKVRPGDPIRVVVIGAIGERKGYNVVLDCARDAVARNLPLEFVVIGHTMDDKRLFEAGKVFITGKYDEPEIAALIRRENAHFAFFPQITPETWCYTLTHALDAGLPVVAFDIGAVAERLRRATASHVLLALDTEAAALNDRLLRIGRDLTANLATIERGDRPPELSSSAETVMVPNNLSPRAQMPPDPAGLTASVETLSLEQGLYLFSVRSAAPTRIGGDQGLVLPALHVGPAPGVRESQVSVLSGPGTNGSWLCQPNDTFIVRVTGGTAMILVTSLRAERMAPLAIEVQRLDGQNGVAAAAIPAPQLALVPAAGTRPSPVAALNPRAVLRPADETPTIPIQIVVHVQNKGDIHFTGSGWAGYIGQRLAIEAFSIRPLALVPAEQIEYKAYTATGIESPWISNGTPCGTRGIAVPLVGFAVRVKPSADGTVYDCEYSGAFTSGKRSGPFTNGAPCRAIGPDDRLEAIQMSLVVRPHAAVADGTDALTAPPAARKPTSRKRIGPRFSALREPPEP